MPIVTKRARELPDLNSSFPIRADARVMHGNLRTSATTIELENGDSAGSTYEVARVPSRARIHKLSRLHVGTAFTGLTDVDIGIADDPDCILDGGSVATTGEKPAATAIPLDLLARPLWKLAGMDKDPSKELSIILTIKAANTTAGVLGVDLVYVLD